MDRFNNTRWSYSAQEVHVNLITVCRQLFFFYGFCIYASGKDTAEEY